jgi:hypothetical protein
MPGNPFPFATLFCDPLVQNDKTVMILRTVGDDPLVRVEELSPTKKIYTVANQLRLVETAEKPGDLKEFYKRITPELGNVLREAGNACLLEFPLKQESAYEFPPRNLKNLLENNNLWRGPNYLLIPMMEKSSPLNINKCASLESRKNAIESHQSKFDKKELSDTARNSSFKPAGFSSALSFPKKVANSLAPVIGVKGSATGQTDETLPVSASAGLDKEIMKGIGLIDNWDQPCLKDLFCFHKYNC